MYSRWFSTSVILLWLATMTWLVTQKVLPPLLAGDPPSYRDIVEAQSKESPIGWRMSLGGRKLGWAITSGRRLPSGANELRAKVHFDHLPLAAVAPGWLKGLVRPVDDRSVAGFRLDLRSTVLVDPLGRLSHFQSALRIHPFPEAIELKGRVEGTRLLISVRSGDFRYDSEAYLHPGIVVGDALAPQAHLPNLRLGQTWRVPAYNPLRSPSSPMEILRATVETTEPISWDGRLEETWLVAVYDESGLSAKTSGPPRGRLWVRRDGAVLKQEAVVFDSILTFARMPDEQSAELLRQSGTWRP